MAKQVLTDLNFGGVSEIQNAIIQNLAAAPANPSAGRFYFNTSDNTLYVYNGTSWMDALGQGVVYTEGDGIDINGSVISVDSATLAAVASIANKIGLTDLSIASGSSNYLGYDNTTGQFSAKVDTTVGTVSTNLVTSGAVQTAINNAISTTYKAAGSVAFASLPTLGSSIEGNVYNVTDSFTTTSDFVEGAGNTYPAGTNVVCINTSGTTYKWDVLAGFIDVSNFITASSTTTLTNKTIDADDNTISDLATGNFKSGVIVTTVGATGADTSIPTEQAVREAITTATSGVAKVYSATNPALTTSSGICTWTVSHGLASANVCAAVYNVSTGKETIVDVENTSSSVTTIKFNSAANISAGTYKVVVIGG